MGMSEDRADSPDYRRLLLGVAVICLTAASALTWWQGHPETASVLFRADILLAAVWLAYPALSSMRWGVVLAVAGGGLLLLTRWRLMAGLVFVVLALALLWGRIRGRGAP